MAPGDVETGTGSEAGPRATIVVCTRDRRELLSQALDCLARLKGLERTEVVVVDNGSSDGSAEVVQARAPGFPIPLRLVSEPVAGHSHARNRGVQSARGAVVVFTDDDCRPREDWLVELLEPFRDERVAAAGGRVVQGSADWLHGPRRMLLPFLRGPLVLYDHGPGLRELLPGKAAPFIGANMAIRRSWLASCGPFRVDLGWGTPASGEDSEYCRRLWSAGARVVYAGDAVVRHELGPDRLCVSYVLYWWSRKLREWVRTRLARTRAARSVGADSQPHEGARR